MASVTKSLILILLLFATITVPQEVADATAVPDAVDAVADATATEDPTANDITTDPSVTDGEADTSAADSTDVEDGKQNVEYPLT